FQAEDGIRDKLVTGVQTCALPIWPRPAARGLDPEPLEHRLVAAPPGTHLHLQVEEDRPAEHRLDLRPGTGADLADHRTALPDERSEERRVGKEGRSRWGAW